MLTGDGVEYTRQMLEAMRDDPRDHEMPAYLAAFLYRLELVDQADDFHRLVDSAAPTSDLAYLLDILRALPPRIRIRRTTRRGAPSRMTSATAVWPS
jgi:hypothetical protein